MKKEVLFVIGILAVLVLLAGCQPQSEKSADEAFKDMEDLSDEELDAVLTENEAVAGQAYSRFPAPSVNRIKQVRKVVKTFSWLSCADSDGGINYPLAGTVTAKYTYGGSSGSKQLSDTCLSEIKLQEYYCKGNTYSRTTADCEFGCEDGACREPEQDEVSPPPPASLCGNMALEEGETCDDGNLLNGDGCSDACEDEAGWKCTVNYEGAAPFSECKKEAQMIDVVDQTVCGDGVVEGVEQCDDGNTLNGDGCSSKCTTEVESFAVCGNGIKQGGEQCDGADFGSQASSCAAYDNEKGEKYLGGNVLCTKGCTYDFSNCLIEKPDLTLFSANYSLVYNATSGKNDVVVKVTVKNSGKAGTVSAFYTLFNASFSLESGLPNALVYGYSQPLPAYGTALLVGKYKPYSMNPSKTACPGTHVVEITADKQGKVAESDESNNVYKLSVTC